MRAQLVSSVSLRRMTQPEDVANQVAFLCSDEGAMISGQSISVCGNVEHLGCSARQNRQRRSSEPVCWRLPPPNSPA